MKTCSGQQYDRTTEQLKMADTNNASVLGGNHRFWFFDRGCYYAFEFSFF